ncbi:MAG: class I SAM-dependent methyltransferase [Clostridia bacterium]|nr:class I SAM-dependent methyltransferase [Clostridia bacterium]
MNNVNKTLYIPLYGKSLVSKKGLFLNDKKAEEIWATEAFKLKGKSKSKWLAYYMGIRSAVFDEWVKQVLSEVNDAVVIHIGCGMDSRVLRVGNSEHSWYDVDFPAVITERRRYYSETDGYKMISGDVRESAWLDEIPETKHAVVVMEGVSMYMSADELKSLIDNLSSHFEKINLLTDCYSVLAAKLSKFKNPINDVGVTKVYGIDDPKILQNDKLLFVKEHAMTPQKYIDKLCGFEKFVFKRLYAGKLSKKLYRLFEYKQ